MTKHRLTNDRRPLYQITDPETRELRYREMFYEANDRQRNSEKSLARAFYLMRRIRDGDEEAAAEADKWIDELTGGGRYG